MHPLTLFLVAAFLPTVWLTDLKALDEFVNRPDPHYNYTFLRTKDGFFLGILTKVDIINMTSQKWLDKSEVDKSVWSHELMIGLFQYTTRLKFRTKSCLLMIVPGQNDALTPRDNLTRRALMYTSVATKSVVAVLRGTLPQPLTFSNHPLGHKNITGYDIVAYTWWNFLHNMTVSPHWLVQFPMVKAVVRAMDTITDYMKKKYRVDVTEFTLAGVGLGGWISWLTAAVDKRVKAIAPVAMDFLNFTESFKHHYRAYCGWSYMLRPFVEMNITQELDNPRFQELASHVDPLEYNERYENVTKYIIVLSGDEFFPPDNSRYYFSQLEGVKLLLIMANKDYGNLHNKTPTPQLIETIASFYLRMVIKNYSPPKISWKIEMGSPGWLGKREISPSPSSQAASRENAGCSPSRSPREAKLLAALHRSSFLAAFEKGALAGALLHGVHLASWLGKREISPSSQAACGNGAPILQQELLPLQGAGRAGRGVPGGLAAGEVPASRAGGEARHGLIRPSAGERCPPLQGAGRRKRPSGVIFAAAGEGSSRKEQGGRKKLPALDIRPYWRRFACKEQG
ncbi:autocrine proliferation repressor protein A-like [Sphaerodactylus townsendi]|uniref:autocrine proliferation repressor protein A-like n=1 Tax=Sphaerodactylus townsendi TaxID=933632 RepID=UPI00202711D7|nr:autocrine proliferation repressor protein A-like [Sphaerodactylus townsendi]